MDESRYEAQRLAALAKLVVLRWPDSPEAAAASQLLVNLAVRGGRLEEAETLLDRLPESNRAAAQISLGGALWRNYLQKLQAPSGQASALSRQRREHAEELLRQGLKTVSSLNQLSPTQAQGALYLAQSLLSRGDAKQSIEVLEDGRAGPLSLLRERGLPRDRADAAGSLVSPEQRSPARGSSAGGFPTRGYAIETYKTALRAYVSVSPPQRQQALAMMDALEQMVAQGGNETDKRQLTRIYVSLGLQLQKQLQQLTASGQGEEAGRVAAAFEDFLQRAGERADAGDWNVQLWIAQTSQQLGTGLAGSGLAGSGLAGTGRKQGNSATPNGENKDGTAGRYFERAIKAYRSLLEKAAKTPDFAPGSDALLGVKQRLSECQFLMGQYDDAVDGYADILRQKPNMLEIQRAAAVALQQWGVAAKRIDAIDQSIRGSMPQQNQKNLIWGWLRLAAIADYAKGKAEAREAAIQEAEPQENGKQAETPTPTQAKQNSLRQKIGKYQDLYFEARFQVIQARFQAAQFSQGAARQKYLRTARQGIKSMIQLYPELGGGVWKEKFKQLQAEIKAEK